MPRRTVWNDTILNFVIADGVRSLLTLSGDFTIADTGGVTLVRTIYDMYANHQVTGGGNSLAQLSMGIGIASQEAFALGTSAVPDPDVAGDHPIQDWVVRRLGMVVEDNTNMAVPLHLMGDIRAQRKIEGAEVFIYTTQAFVVGAGFNVHVLGLVRCLYLLP